MTKNQRSFDRPVMMSSEMPSAKYSCSESPLMFTNGNTAMEGRSEAARSAPAPGATGLGNWSVTLTVLEMTPRTQNHSSSHLQGDIGPRSNFKNLRLAPFETVENLDQSQKSESACGDSHC